MFEDVKFPKRLQNLNPKIYCDHEKHDKKGYWFAFIHATKVHTINKIINLNT